MKCYEEIGGDAMLTRKREVLSQRDAAERDEEFDIDDNQDDDIDKRQRFRPYDRGNNKEYVSESVSVPRRRRDVYGDFLFYYELMKIMFAEQNMYADGNFSKIHFNLFFLLFER